VSAGARGIYIWPTVFTNIIATEYVTITGYNGTNQTSTRTELPTSTFELPSSIYDFPGDVGTMDATTTVLGGATLVRSPSLAIVALPALC
jgi:hypothetical protein